MKSDSKVSNKFLREQLTAGRFAPVITEARAEGMNRLILMSDLRTLDTSRQRDLMRSIPNKDEYTHAAINPATGVFGIYQIERPASEHSDSDNSSISSATEEAGDKAIALSKKTLDTGRTAEHLAKQVADGKIQDFSSLAKAVPDEKAFKGVLEHLAKMRQPVKEFETSQGTFVTGGHPNARASLPSSTTAKAKVVVHDVNEEKNGRVGFKILEVAGGDFGFKEAVGGQRMIFADLDTPNNQKTLALIHFSRFHGTFVWLELMPSYQIAERRWTIKVSDILEKDELLAMDKPARQLFDE